MRPQVACHGLRAPALGVQGHHRQAPLAEFRDLVVGREAAHEPQRDGLLFEHPRDRLAVRAPSEAHVDRVGYLVGVEAGVLGLKVHDEPPHRWREPAASRRPRAEEAFHALGLEASHPAVEGTLGGGAGLARPLRDGSAEQGQRADLFVGQLLRSAAQQCELLPLVGRLDAASASSPAHLRFPPRSAVPRERKDATTARSAPGDRLGRERWRFCWSGSPYGSQGLRRGLTPYVYSGGAGLVGPKREA